MLDETRKQLAILCNQIDLYIGPWRSIELDRDDATVIVWNTLEVINWLSNPKQNRVDYVFSKIANVEVYNQNSAFSEAQKVWVDGLIDLLKTARTKISETKFL